MSSARDAAINKALNSLCLGRVDWFDLVDELINMEFKYCFNEQQRAQVVVDWVKACESLHVTKVKDEILKRYNR